MSISLTTADLSRAVQLRRANQELKGQMAALTHEITTGQRHDLAAAQRGDRGALAFMGSQLTALEALSNNATLIGNDLQAVQTAFSGIETVVQDFGAAFIGHGLAGNPATLSLAARQAAAGMETVVGALNVSVGGRYLLSGASVDVPPISPATDILASARAIAAAQPTAGQAIAALDAWFAAPAGAGGLLDQAYHGVAGGTGVPISPGTKIGNPVDASAAGLRDIMKGLAIAALAGDPPAAFGEGAAALLIGAAGERMVAGGMELTKMQAAVGVAQATVEQAATRNGAEISSLKIMQSKLVSADPYETATALTEAQGRLESLYALTARLSRLSLAEYL
ncbi:hypothetical protein KTN05_08940 [Paracoccus sp. Z118]|uniref:flagellin N-terminal helical domain-containing protein n=1 Tax=Paracoccus sp. Z118 TaxID=2851017 RepID=UPI001C2B7E5D|nr:flagellin [Paracoccus sp. Z118]MBV0891975.1 hypothetical protein [Paracoccus sp. Z118]